MTGWRSLESACANKTGRTIFDFPGRNRPLSGSTSESRPLAHVRCSPAKNGIFLAQLDHDQPNKPSVAVDPVRGEAVSTAVDLFATMTASYFLVPE